MAENKEIKNAKCCEFCNLWEDGGAYHGKCPVWQCNTSLTEVCDKFVMLDKYAANVKKMEKLSVA